MLSKNDAIRVAIELIGIGLSEGVQVISAVGMTGAASIERAIHYTQSVGSFPGIAFTKLGGEYALVFDAPFLLKESRPVDLENYLFIDLIDSTKFISKNGRNQLVDLMTGIKNFIESECDGELEGYRKVEMISLQDFHLKTWLLGQDLMQHGLHLTMVQK